MSGCHDTNISKSSLIVMMDEKIKELKDKVQALSYYSANQIDENQNIHNRIDVLKGKIKDQLKDIDSLIEINKCLVKRVDNIESKSVSFSVIHSSSQTHDTWKTGYEILISKIDNRITKIEKWIEEHKKESNAFFMKMEERDNSLSTRIDELQTGLNLVKTLGARAYHPKKPHTCPVCNGSGKQLNVLLSMPPIYPDCNSCDGKGIVWG